MKILRQKYFGRIKYPEDWDESDFDYLKTIDKESDKKLVKDAVVSAGVATLPSITGMVLNKKFKLHPEIGLPIGGLRFLLGRLSDNSKDIKKKYRKLKTKEERNRFRNEVELNPGIIKTIKNNTSILSVL